MTPAPFNTLLQDPPPKADAFWMRAEDGVRLRAAHWAGDRSTGTVLLFPGRTEYLEKYNSLALDLNAAGLDVLSLDWRGQGLSDRLLSDPRPGHVAGFADYRRDVVELVVTADELDLPRPWHLLAHSMGGAIGLAALDAGLPVQSAVFSAPMWGLDLSRPVRLLAHLITGAAERLGLGHYPAWGSGGYEPFVLNQPFRGNLLTTDGARWGRLIAELASWPEIGIGGVSNHWLREALAECRRLGALSAPAQPTLVALGSEERIVSPDAIRSRLDSWPQAKLMLLPGARHEPLMERESIREPLVEAVIAHFLAPREAV
ncbi:alpha/beta fold hydrolase [Paracoccus sp. MBLB3053]|uniref:Alpha/beta fold hydrolase n=1 Tax=Paracoccus aurantius TaxID=3073814 RepID=A0ABU2HUN4_9RHOB|nr:alpha/beta fold hydrolase [Paracoccus sp. MBLB3053]MDS9468452.1 alpha/beta fold hydrolase [Paracoccus sp. MBLB3053]